jgi:hypothetical protein
MAVRHYYIQGTSIFGRASCTPSLLRLAQPVAKMRARASSGTWTRAYVPACEIPIQKAERSTVEVYLHSAVACRLC